MDGGKAKKAAQHRIEWLLDLKPCDFRRQLLKRYLKDIRQFSKNTKESIRAKYLPSERTEESISVLTQFCGSNLNVVRICVQSLGLVEVLDSSQVYDVIWCGTSEIPPIKLQNRLMNKFPGAANILSKISLFRALELHRHLFPSAYKFYPQTWFLPFQTHSFFTASVRTSQAATESGKPTYIVKPDCGTQGKGIYLIQSPQFYIPPTSHHTKNPGAIMEVGSMGRQNRNVNWLQPALDVVQVYEPNPVLLNGCKTDLRIYALIESLSPLRIHVYRDGLVRVASREYEKPDRTNLNKCTMHLTNYAINKLHEPPAQANSGEGVDETQSTYPNSNCQWHCKYSLYNLLHLSENSSAPKGPNSDAWGKINAKKLWSELDNIIRRTIFTLVPHLKVAYWAEFGHQPQSPKSYKNRSVEHPPQCFQILGFDFLLVEPNFRPVLLEVNSNPSLRTDAMHCFPTTVSSQTSLYSQFTSATTNSLKSSANSLMPARLTRAFTPCGPVAEAATALSSILGDRYAEFERSDIDEQVKGGLVLSTLKMMSVHIRRMRKRCKKRDNSGAESTCVTAPSTCPSSLVSSGGLSQPQGVQLPTLLESNPDNGVNNVVWSVLHASNALNSAELRNLNIPISNSLPEGHLMKSSELPECSRASSKLQGTSNLNPTPANSTECDLSTPVNRDTYTETCPVDRNTNALRTVRIQRKLPRLRSKCSQGQLVRKGSATRDIFSSSSNQISEGLKISHYSSPPAFLRSEEFVPFKSPRCRSRTHPLWERKINKSLKIAPSQCSLSSSVQRLPQRAVSTGDRKQPLPSENLASIQKPNSTIQEAAEKIVALAPMECIYSEGSPPPTENGVHSGSACEERWCAEVKSRLCLLSKRKLSCDKEPWDSTSSSTTVGSSCVPLAKSLNLEAFDSSERVIDLLADMFLATLSKRRQRLAHRSPPKGADSITDDWTSPANEFRTDHPPTKSVLIPHMDLSSFRAFCRRCHIDQLGLTFIELDMIFVKHRNWWQKVYEAELMKHTRELSYLKGLSFAAFIDLCVQLADFCYSTELDSGILTSSAHLPIIPLNPVPMEEEDDIHTASSPDRKAKAPAKSDLKTVHSQPNNKESSKAHFAPKSARSKSKSLINLLRFIEHCCGGYRSTF
ncbi:unnamed protein product [Calicophoron daubneyi]|uniref:Tubulin polyglutamylase TTLL11 n=1 Tax=Calicophoron daubneyi TaxID=300641 RepID=A0AAV2T6F8_CALDB